MNLARSLALTVALAMTACDSSSDPSDASVSGDASVSRDASPADASPRGARPPADAGQSLDSGPADMGVRLDATAPDAEDLDSGVETDAGEADTGVETDAGSQVDAGEVDAGPPEGCELGQVSSTATTSNLDLFGTPAYFNQGQPVPAGTYRITYVDGCMKYASSQGWTVNAYAANQSCWYVVGVTTSDRIVVPPGTVGYSVGGGAYANFEDCVTASLQVPPVEFTLAQPTPLGVWLLDSPYSDNVAGIDNRNPTWRLSVVTSTCPP